MFPRAVFVAVAAGAVCVPHLAMAQEKSPLFLTLSQTLRKDSNFTRTTKAERETISVTALTAGVDESYGRQTYRASAQLGHVNYSRFGDLLNNDTKDLDGSVSSEFGANWQATLSGNFSENLTSPQDNVGANRVVRNIRRYRDTNLAVRYGNGGRWSLIGTLDRNRLNYSLASYQFLNAQQNSTGLRLVYNASDLLSFGLGPRWVKTTYPVNRDNESIEDRNLDFTTNWQISGLSNLNLLLSVRDSESSAAGARRTNALTGALGWTYTPRGLLSYGVNVTRATNADRFTERGQFQAFGNRISTVQNVTTDTINTTLSLSSQYRITGKVFAGAGYAFTQYESSRDRDRTTSSVVTFNDASSTSADSHQQTLTLSLSYQPIRSVGLRCGWQTYSQTADVFGRQKYDGHSTDCSASFTLD
ncbi:MAG: hypothetical protein I8H76_13165 [Burkholderiales bacterium]|nr:hypothetical protein [Burkholderiales bacterium]MBH2017117.1 hypothetical protein [Burkholderiales bacterium]